MPENLQLPDENGTGMGIFIMPGIIHACGVSQPVGGSGGLTDALVRCFENLGGELLLNAKVGKVLVEGGVAVGLRRAGGAEMRGSDGVIAALHPHVLSCFVAGIDPEVDRRAKSVTLPTQSLPTLAQIVSHYDLRLRTKYRAGAEITTATMLGYFPFTDLASLLDDFDYLRRKRILPRRLLTWPKVISPQIMVARARQLPP